MNENITISKSIAEQICKYCEDNAFYDKLGKYNDVYYKLKSLLRNET